MLVSNPGKNIIRLCFGSKEFPKAEQSIIGISIDSNTVGTAAESEIRLETKENGALEFYLTDSKEGEGAEDQLLLRMYQPELAPQPVMHYQNAGGLQTIKTVDGERTFADNLIPVHDRTAYRAKLYFDLKPDETIHGFGQAEEGIFDYRHENQYLYQHNMRSPMPFFVSSRHYGILIDTGSLMYWNPNEGHHHPDAPVNCPYLFLDTVDYLDLYFIYGASYDDIIKGYRLLTGKAPLLPKWAYGYIQSKCEYRTQEELLSIVKKYRELHIPLDCVVQDWNTWEAGKWGNKHVDKKRFPDLKAANDEIHRMHCHSMISIWPTMSSGEDHDEMKAKQHLLLDDSTYDAFSEEGRKIYWQQFNKDLFSSGFDSMWADSTEPFTGLDWNGAVLREPFERYMLVGGEHKKYLDAAKASTYTLEHSKGLYEGQRETTDTKRVIVVTRSAWAGIQRYGVVPWSGDISATWPTLKKQVTEGINMAASGLPWWSNDAGAFFVVKDNYPLKGCGHNQNPFVEWFWHGAFEQGINDSAFREFYTRWLQYACFLPIMRSHGSDAPREIWNFGSEGEPYYDAIEDAIRLRYKLLPYIYSLAGMAHFDSYTLLRGLFFDFPEDKTACAIEDQYMFGPALLVCPVTEPNATERRCYLPETSAKLWYDFYTNTAYKAGQWVTADAPLNRIPLFVPGGSIIPVEPKCVEYADETSDEPLELRVYAGCNGHFTLYEDSGDGYAYEKGEYNRVSLNWCDDTGVLTVEKAEKLFNNSINKRLYTQSLVDKPDRA
ncbi:MAG: DUF5110 domain-containing protein [Spirochaetaceae bacterium]|jgi:alpha-D-xyloside xylohydrolase|nr:DUF5110 domain-containing protein [Spirochaetaceae bacterium]